MFFYPIVHILACKYPLEVLLFSWMRYVKGKCIPLFHGDSFSFRYIYPYIDGCLKMIVRWCFYQNWSVFIFLGLGAVEGGGIPNGSNDDAMLIITFETKCYLQHGFNIYNLYLQRLLTVTNSLVNCLSPRYQNGK